MWNLEGLHFTGMCEVTPTHCHISLGEMEKARWQLWYLKECGNLGSDLDRWLLKLLLAHYFTP